MSPALAASQPHSPYGPQWALGPRDLPQGALAGYCQWATCQRPLLPSSQPPPPAPSQRQLTPGKFRVFPLQWAQPLLWFGCKQLQVPRVMMCSLPRLSLQCHPCLLAALDFRFCQDASRLGRQAPQLTVKSVMLNPSSGKKGERG